MGGIRDFPSFILFIMLFLKANRHFSYTIHLRVILKFNICKF